VPPNLAFVVADTLLLGCHGIHLRGGHGARRVHSASGPALPGAAPCVTGQAGDTGTMAWLAPEPNLVPPFWSWGAIHPQACTVMTTAVVGALLSFESRVEPSWPFRLAAVADLGSSPVLARRSKASGSSRSIF
jgi:hypothetical protein